MTRYQGQDQRTGIRTGLDNRDYDRTRQQGLGLMNRDYVRTRLQGIGKINKDYDRTR